MSEVERSMGRSAAGEQGHIDALARDIRIDLRACGRRYPLFNVSRFPAVAAVTATYLPDRTRQERSLVALMSLWLFAFDDLVDERQLIEPELTRATARYRIVAERGPTALIAGDDQLAIALGEIIGRLASCSSAAPLMPRWRQEFARMLDSIVTDRALSATLLERPTKPLGEGDTPTYDEWMAHAQYSVGVHQHLVACLMLYDEPDLIPRLPILLSAIDESARACRLANDLRTWAKERHEGNFSTFAAVATAIRRSEPALSVTHCRERARQHLIVRLVEHLTLLDVRLAASPTPQGAPEMALRRFTKVITDLYAHRDFHTFSPPIPSPQSSM